MVSLFLFLCAWAALCTIWVCCLLVVCVLCYCVQYWEHVRLQLCPVDKRTCAFEMREFQCCVFWRILYLRVRTAMRAV
jgi:hypothetical protein